MTDNPNHSPPEEMESDHHGKQDAAAQEYDGGHAQGSDIVPPSEVDTDYEASFLAESDLEGSWATVSSSSADAGTSAVDDLTSGDEGEDDAFNCLSPLDAASAVHSGSELDAFSDSDVSEVEQSANRKPYEYVTDQSWTDPEDATASNSTRSTVPGSFSRGMPNAKTPMHSRTSTLTEAHLNRHSRKQLAEAQGQSIVQLSDSQVELVFPRIAADFGAGSVETITSSTPLLPIEEQSNASYDPRPTQHNFRANHQQLPEDDYVVLANSAVGTCTQSVIAGRNVDTGAAAHHAFSTYPLNGRRGEKRQRLELVGIDQREKHGFNSSIGPLADDEHSEPCKGEQDPEQEQLEEQFVREIPERVVDIDKDGYERLNTADAYSDSVDNVTDNLPWDTPQPPSSPTARVFGLRTKCSVPLDWLDAVSDARSRGQIVIELATNSTETARLTGIAPERDLTFDYMPLQQEISSKAEATEPVSTAEDAPAIPPSRSSGPARHLHLPGMFHVKALVIALPLLAIIMLSRFSTIIPENAPTVETERTPGRTVSKPVLVTCTATPETFGQPSHFQCVHIGNADIPVTSSAPEVAIADSWETSSDAETMSATTVNPDDSREQATLLVPSSVPSHCDKNVFPTPVGSVTSTAIPTVPTFNEHADRLSPCESHGEQGRARASNSPPDIPIDAQPRSQLTRDGDWRMLDSQTDSAVFPVEDASWYDRFFEHSLALTTAMDHAFRSGHDALARLISNYMDTLSRSVPHRNSGRKLFTGQAAALFEETDALKKRIRSEMSALLEAADQHLQDLALDVDKAVKHSREKILMAIKEAADGVEKHVGVEIPLPFVERDPARNRTKSTVSNWAEKFWQTLHHATVTLVI